jgi:AraC family transcriptional regulator
MWDELFSQYGEQLKKFAKSGPGYGAMDRYDSETHTFEYLAGYETEPTTEAPEGLTTWAIPEQTYAVIRCTIKTIGDAYAYFNQEWLPEAGYQRAAGPEFEFYGAEFHGGDAEPIHMYLPIEKRAS